MSARVPSRHPRPLIWFHWLTLLLVLTAVLVALSREWIDSRELRALLLDAHRQIGLVVFGLTLVRLLWRGRGEHAFAADADGAHRWLVRGSHASFYLLLAVLPVLGLLASQARGQAVHLLGLPLPTLLARNRDLAEQITEIHEWSAWSLLALAAGHAAAALWHHYIRGDDTLRRMLPSPRIR